MSDEFYNNNENGSGSGDQSNRSQGTGGEFNGYNNDIDSQGGSNYSSYNSSESQGSSSYSNYSGSLENNNSGSADNGANCTYHYSYKDDTQAKETARWEPDSSKYNSEPEAPKAETKKKKKSHWWIPLVAVGGALLVGIIVACVFGISLITKVFSNSTASGQISGGGITQEIIAGEDQEEESTAGSLIINEAQDVTQSSSTGSVVLTDVSDVVDQVMPAVVSITSRTLVSNGSYGGFFNYYFGNQGGNSNQTQEVESGVGSGTIVAANDEELLILTSYHVVEGCSSLYVTFCDGSAVDGYIKDASENDDIAIVALRRSDISDSTWNEIAIAKMSDVQPAVGDGVVVIGNALGYGQSVVTGIVSALDRQITVENNTITVIQTDAAINSGNSGGCLLNSNGEIVGISEAKINSSSVEGMCYAISINYYYDTIMSMLEEAPAAQEEESSEDSQNQTSGTQTAYLGIRGYDIGSQLAQSYGIPEGVYVVSTVTGGGAAAADIEEGDVIISIDGSSISSMTELQNALTAYEPGDTVVLGIMRYTNNGYEEIQVNVTLTNAIG